MAALHPQVDVAEQREKGRRAGDDAHRELGGQTQADFLARGSSDRDGVFLRFFHFLARPLMRVRFENGEVLGDHAENREPAATIESVTAISLHFGT